MISLLSMVTSQVKLERLYMYMYMYVKISIEKPRDHKMEYRGIIKSPALASSLPEDDDDDDDSDDEEQNHRDDDDADGADHCARHAVRIFRQFIDHCRAKVITKFVLRKIT